LAEKSGKEGGEFFEKSEGKKMVSFFFKEEGGRLHSGWGERGGGKKAPVSGPYRPIRKRS